MEIRGAGALVTGASQGLGAALARELARRGARVVLAARRARALDEVVAAIRAEGGEAHAAVADLGRKEDIEPLAGTASALLGTVDLLVHNASTLGPVPLRPLLEAECEDLAAVLEVNLLGPFRLTKAVAGSMALRGRGLVLGISSDAAVTGYPGWGPYGVSKAALDHLHRTWAAELEASGVKVLSVDPGEMDTEMHAQALPEADRTTLARPERVAVQIAELIAASASLTNGSRLDAARAALAVPA